MTEQTIVIPPLNTKVIELVLIGDNSLICHKFSEKAKKQIEDKQQKKAKGGREKRKPEEEFKQSLHVLNGQKDFKKQEFGFPAGGLKKAMLWVAADIEGVAGTQVKRHLHVLADDGNLLKIHGDRPRMREDWVRIARGTTDMRYRGEFLNWHLKPKIKYNADIFSPEQVINLINHAGCECGVGEWRPGSPKSPGDHGIFHVATEEERKALK